MPNPSARHAGRFAGLIRLGAPDTLRGRVLGRVGTGVMLLYVSHRADRIAFASERAHSPRYRAITS